MTGHDRTVVTLNTLETTLDTAVVSVLRPDGHAGTGTTVNSVALVDATDLGTGSAPEADLLFLTGDAAGLLARRLTDRTGRTQSGTALPDTLPPLLAVREGTFPRVLPALAVAAGSTVIVLDSRARWDILLPRVQQLLTGGSTAAPGGTATTTSSLEELAVLIAEDTGGLVTVEDAANRMLAYSPSLNAADDIRARAILGREATAPVMALFSTWNVVDTITRTTGVVRVPTDPELGMRSRLITGIHRTDGTLLGSIWVQEGPEGFTGDAAEVLRGGAVTAAAVLQRMVDGVGREDSVLHRLFGEHGPADATVAADLLGITTDATAVVIGIAPGAGAVVDTRTLTATVKRLRIHVGALWRDARAVLLGRRIYLLLPRVPAGTDVTAWTLQLLERFDDRDSVRALALRAAIAAVGGAGVAPGSGVPQARQEVDRVLDSPGTGASGPMARVTSFDRSRTSVLLSEIMARLTPWEDFADPRLAVVVDYDAAHGAYLVETLRTYLRSGCNARDAARVLNLHPNTLRYRITRIEALSGLDLRDPDDRLLTEIGLLARG